MTDKAQAESGKVITIGLGQINNPTPQFMKYIMRGAQFLSGVWALLPQDLFTNLSDAQYSHINKWIIVGNTVLLFAIKFFGWDYKN